MTERLTLRAWNALQEKERTKSLANWVVITEADIELDAKGNPRVLVRKPNGKITSRFEFPFPPKGWKYETKYDWHSDAQGRFHLYLLALSYGEASDEVVEWVDWLVERQGVGLFSYAKRCWRYYFTRKPRN